MSDALWLDAGPVTAIPPRGARVMPTANGSIALFRTSDDRVFALRDRCPHRGGPLSQGIVHGTCVTCPLHDWVIEVSTGAARAPDEGAVETFAVRIERGRVLVEVVREAVGADPEMRACDTRDEAPPLAQSA